MRVIVTGSRNWLSRSVVWDQLGDLHVTSPYLVVVHGACPTGADHWADEWGFACMNAGFDDILLDRYPAQWDSYGKSAGFKRDKEMVDTGANLCLAFIRHYSPGATHTRGLALAAGIPVRTFREDIDGIYLGEDK